MPTARLPADRVGSRALTRSADAASAPFQWLAGKVAGGRPVNFLAPNAAARPGGGEGEAGAGPEVVWEVGFAELKEAVLREVLGGDSESPWRQDVEHVLQRFVDHLHIVEVCMYVCVCVCVCVRARACVRACVHTHTHTHTRTHA